MSSPSEYDVVVVGGGHAGCEAALAAARLGARTLLVTKQFDRLGAMPCNPSIGGIAKSHLVFELDALGGEMARNADYAGIQFRVLNMRKGPAVRANRVQCDKAAYAARMQAVIASEPNLEGLEDSISGLLVCGESVIGVATRRHGRITAGATIVCAGTSLHGTIHVGAECSPGGGGGLPASHELAANLHELGFRMGRLKTGTPCRIDGRTIDYSVMTPQPGVEPPPFLSWEARQVARMFHVEHGESGTASRTMFHVEHEPGSVLMPWIPGADQMSCYMTHTTALTHQIIRDNLERSAMYGGHIDSTGVRYCPSVEDKIVKFPQKESHHVFVEPEGRSTSRVYPNGVSNSLPRDVQAAMMASIPGFGDARIEEWAYGIQYDFVDPTECLESLETKRVRHLFLAGQVLGTTGYEEAAALGFMAGINAVRSLREEPPVVLRRDEAYIGVLIDDLVTKGTDEPYRMFTSRAEHRLLLRQDNARFRMLVLADELGIARSRYRDETRGLSERIDKELLRLKTSHGHLASWADVLKRPGAVYADLGVRARSLPPEVCEQVEMVVRYSGYIEREQRIASRGRALEGRRIPADLDYAGITQLRFEARERFSRIMPETLGQASRIPGITPADVSVLMVMLARREDMQS